MPCPKLSPLQARFAASFAVTLFSLLVYFLAFSPRLAYSTDVDLIASKDISHLIPIYLHIPADLDSRSPVTSENRDDGDTPHQLDVTKRPPADFALENNVAKQDNIRIGEVRYWYFPAENQRDQANSSSTSRALRLARSKSNEFEKDVDKDLFMELEGDNIDLSRRSSTVYVTANTCLQPDLNATQTSKDAGAPQLRMYISQSESIQQPGPGIDDPEVIMKEFDSGYARVDLDAGRDVYIGIAALNTSRYDGVYNYEIAASVDEPFHYLESYSQNLYFVDSDSSAALLITESVDEEYQRLFNSGKAPLTMFAHNINDSAIIGLHNSYCGLKMNAQIKKAFHNVEVGITTRGVDRLPKQQFYIKGLNHSSSYYGFLALEPNSTVPRAGGVIGGGGKLWKSMNFTTKREENCAIVYDLDFCSEVAYAVPSNPSLNKTQLADIYDKNAAALYKNFSYSLQQIPCNASDSEQYSLARNCTHCAEAYKQWLCAVTIPRCHDFTSSLDHLQERNTGQAFLNGTMLPDDYPGRANVASNSSRNSIIDTEIKPGPYKEVLPCIDLCHELVRSCPSALGFRCPRKEWLEASYGKRSGNNVTCSYFGAAFYINDGRSVYRNGYAFAYAFLSLIGFWSFVWVLDI
ncbi:hypothetical protein VTO42DRAFT_3273 [Malbranchea cinnamomea]